MDQPLFWADQLAFGVRKKFEDRETYVCASGISPSGTVHAGNFREIITTDFVVKALKHQGEETRFIYSWDDYDRFRKVPANLPDEWEQYLGLPLSKVPDPEECHASYARHFEAQLEDELDDLGMDIEFIGQTEQFEQCAYADGIKNAMQYRDTIRSILDEYRQEPLADDWWPIRIFCKACGKDFTDVIDYDGEYTVTYECEKCQDTFELDFSEEAGAKPPWRVDWPMRWDVEQVSFEPGGKEHSVEGGSRTTAVEIVKQVYGTEPPVYQMYEFVTKEGKKISSSSGEETFTISDLKAIYTPSMIRFLFSETKPNKAFEIPFDEDIIERYDTFDRIEEAYFDPDSIENERKREHWKRVYEMCMIDLPAEQPVRVPFNHLAFVAQVYPRDQWVEEGFASLLKTGHIPDEMTEDQRERLLKRMEKAEAWAHNHAPDRYVYELHDTIPTAVADDLSTEQRDAMLHLADVLDEESCASADELDDRLFGVQEETELDTGTFFTTAYRCLLDRDDGPRLSTLIMALGEQRVASLLSTLA